MRAVVLVACLGAACMNPRADGPGTSAAPPAAVVVSPEAQAKAQKAFEEGIGLAGEGKNLEATAAFARAIELDPNHGLAHVEKAQAHLMLEDDPKVIASLLARAVALLPDNPRAHHQYADACAAIGDDPCAEEHWRKAIQIRPDLVEARLALAALLEKKGKAGEARAELEAAVKAAPKNTQARVQLGELLASEQRWAEAAENLEAAANVVARSAALYRRAAALYESAQNKPAASKLRAIADKLDPPAKERKLRELPKARASGK